MGENEKIGKCGLTEVFLDTSTPEHFVKIETVSSMCKLNANQGLLTLRIPITNAADIGQLVILAEKKYREKQKATRFVSNITQLRYNIYKAMDAFQKSNISYEEFIREIEDISIDLNLELAAVTTGGGGSIE